MKLSKISLGVVSFYFHSIFVECFSEIRHERTLIPIYRSARAFLINAIYRSKDAIDDYFAPSNKLQPYITSNFPCNITNTRSKVRPKNVNEVRPGDIDVIGAMGDSLTAGFGVLSSDILSIITEYRGLVFTAGGQESWREYLTLPNILKVFNPNIYGYSWATSLSTEKPSGLNVAEAIAKSRDMPHMAQVLIRKLRNNPKVNFTEDWKMITIFIGSNDICSVCFEKNQEKFLNDHRENMKETLRILRDYSPKTIVNYITIPNLLKLQVYDNLPLSCQIYKTLECGCLFGRTDSEKYEKVIKKWQDVDREVASLDEFDTEDFTVILQPFWQDAVAPRDNRGKPDERYLSDDCFHLSQRGHYIAANSLWNNLLEPVHKKSTNLIDFNEKFLCPTEEQPYILTRKNSERGL